MASNRLIRDYMTPLPHTIGLRQPLEEAAKRMHDLGVRHLPVLEGGQLMGILSDRDIALARALGDEGAELSLNVEEAMSAEPYAVTPETGLQDVARAMAEHKYGCAVVMEGVKVVGLFTTVDALRTLSALVADRHLFRRAELLPSQVRERVMAEHVQLRAELDRVDEVAGRVLDGATDQGALLRSGSHDLYRNLLHHMELEESILVPVLRESDSFGAVRVEQLKAEHERQRAQLAQAFAQASDDEAALATLARSVRKLIADIRKDMEHEEKELLNPSLLRDTAVNADIFTG